MAVTDLFAGEIATELLKQLIMIARKSASCRHSAEQLINYIYEILPIIQEIKHTGVELNQHRQRQMDDFSQRLKDGLQLSEKILKSPRWNVYQNIRLAKKMEKFEKTVSRFMNGTIQAHVLADVHHLRVGVDQGLDHLGRRLDAIKIGADGGGGRLGEAVNRMEEEVEATFVHMSAGMELAKRKVKEMLIGRDDLPVVGVHGIGGSGKTTLAREICKDDDIKSYFGDRVFIFTVSQSPDVDQLKRKIWETVPGYHVISSDYMKPSMQSLLVLDDVWNQQVLGKLLLKVPGCKIIVVSRVKFPQSVVSCSYELELLRDEEAMGLFCHFAFGKENVPPHVDKKLVKQVVDECKGLPLALKVIGSALKDQPEMFWVSAKSRLSRGQLVCESHEVQLLERMKLSVDYLPEKTKECFLDLGAFPEDKKIPLDILINMWVELHDIEEEEAFAILVELSDKNLFTLVKDARAGDKYSSYYEISVYQHDVLRDLALHLSNQGDVNQRKRLLMPKTEARLPKEWERNMDQPFNARVISVHTGEMREDDWFRMDFPMAEVLILNFSSDEYFLPPFLGNMPKLRALVLINYSASNTVLHNLSVFSCFSNLRSLWFEKVRVPQLPETTKALKSLRKISLILCDINNSLNGSNTDLPSLFPHLSELTIDHCINLHHLPSSICDMHALTSLSLTNCDDLQELPTDIGRLRALRILRLYACPNIKRLPSAIRSLVLLTYIDISQCVNMECLPEGIGECISLEKIDMRECPQINSLPGSVMSMRSLRLVVCDEEVSWMWEDMKKSLSGLCVQVPKACFDLDWLSE